MKIKTILLMAATNVFFMGVGASMFDKSAFAALVTVALAIAFVAIIPFEKYMKDKS